MADRTDVLVIGGGPAGYVAAIRLAQLGKQVTVVERERVGGVCLNWGCIPVKALLHSAAILRNAVEARQMGLMFQPPEVNVVSLMGWKARIVDRLVRGIEFLFKANGIRLVRGTARLEAPQRVVVSDTDGERIVEAEHVVVATGSRASTLKCLEGGGKQVIDSNGALELVDLPGRLVAVGAGVVGLEFATVFSRLGCEVTVLELRDQVLPGTDPDIAALVQKLMQREGIKFELGVSVAGLERDDGLAVRFRREDEERSIPCDKILAAVGREPLTDGLGLERVGAKTDKLGFVRVDRSYCTTARDVYAIGDVIGGPLLAHKAMAQGILLAETLSGKAGGPRKYRAIPSCVYTDPEVAVVGLTETEAAQRKKNVKVARVPLNAVGRSLTLGRSEGFCKLIVDERTDKVLGAALVAPQADALIAEAAAAVELGLTADKLGRVVHPHPTMSELLFEAAESIHGRAIHIANR